MYNTDNISGHSLLWESNSSSNKKLRIELKVLQDMTHPKRANILCPSSPGRYLLYMSMSKL